MKYEVLNLPRVSDTAMTYQGKLVGVLKHPFYAWLGLRPVLAQHTEAEHAALGRWAAGRSTLVEIGVAEGVSALALRENMADDASLYLIDPFHLSRLPSLNFMKRAAHRAVEGCPRGKVVWIEDFSGNAARQWRQPIDLLLIDGDHSDEGVRKDWEDWSGFVQPGGIAIFHDARIFEGGWPTAAYGPVRLVDNLFRGNRDSEWAIVGEIHSLVVVERRA